MIFLHKQRTRIAFFLLLVFLVPGFSLSGYAITSGPTLPEFSGYQVYSPSDLVDPFTGDFSYNIPLFDLPGPDGGYPFNLSYAAGVQMEDEASWVGLGWSLNVGAINRMVRGLPDEFKGDTLFNTVSMAPSVTVGARGNLGLEFFGKQLGDQDSDGNLNLGFGVYHNNLNGPGYSLSADIGLSDAVKSPYTPRLSLDLDSNTGGTIGMGLNYIANANSLGVHGSYNSRSGLNSVGFYGQISRLQDRTLRNALQSYGITSHNLNFVHPTFTPVSTQEMIHSSFSASLKVGASVLGVFPNGSVYGYYNESKLKNRGKRMPSPGFGYMNFQHVEGKDYVADVMREKEGMVNKYTPNLAIPHLTFDLFQVQSAGISGTLRPYRTQIEVIEESVYKSESIGASAGFDAGYKKLGVNVVPSFSENKTKNWSEGSDVLDPYKFKKSKEVKKPYSFQFTSDKRVRSKNEFEKIGGFEATSFNIEASQMTSNILSEKMGYGGASNLPVGSLEENSTTKGVLPLLNEDLINGSETLLDEFKIFFKNSSGLLEELDRSQFPKHHIGGFVIIDESGNRYTYGLPVYNLVHEEYSFTTNPTSGLFADIGSSSGPNYQINGTKEYLKKTEIPPYAISYLLTSIQGPSYVDNGGNGISADDLGYWVKFNYQKASTNSSPYKWRDPFSKSHYSKGLLTDIRDDLGSFNYGEKELYYLESAETKTHIAKFILEDRQDGLGVGSRFQDTPVAGATKQKRLKEVLFFTRAGGESEPLKHIIFNYDYSLCPGTPNSSNGKLTLTKLIVNQGTSVQGSQTPYHFKYSDFNPSYSAYSKDRWGNYKPLNSSNSIYNTEWPYVDQGLNSKSQQDQYASAWNLKEIITPTGAQLIVDYESDDYGYVQNLNAAAMTKMSFASGVQQSGERQVFTFDPEASQALVRFSLVNPISGTLNAQEQREEVEKYLDMNSGEVFVKLHSNLRKPGDVDYFEKIEGYLKFKSDGAMYLETDQSGNYTYGVFELIKVNGNHPFSDLAWKHIEVNQPYLANLTSGFTPGNSDEDRVKMMRGLASIIASFRETIQGFTNYCKNNNWGRQIDLELSGVRLNDPTKRKFGGGHRVRQLTIKDNWKETYDGVYGQVFEYITEDGGQEISSGVASYEPFVGGDENPLRVSRQYKEQRKLRSDANFYFEYPINESLYPSPMVGYEKVNIWSLPAAKKAGLSVLNRDSPNATKPFLPESTTASFGTSGMKQFEFYTAKDFPTLTYETSKIQKESNFLIKAFGALDVQSKILTASQGYSIVLNDMHGKPKAEKAFSQNTDGDVSGNPISWTKYNYFNQAKVVNQKRSGMLNNFFKKVNDFVVSKVGPEQEETFDQLIGVNAEVVLDVREISDITSSGGLNFNADLVFIWPAITVWPFVGRVENRLKTVVVNKVVYQFGVVESIESSNLGSKLLTTSLNWDILTGQPVLSQVNNNFEAPLYSLQRPAYHVYAGMGPASQNLGFEFDINRLTQISNKPNHYYGSINSTHIQTLKRGDEIGVYTESNGLKIPSFRMIFLGENLGRAEFFIWEDPAVLNGSFSAKVMRSGFRNQLAPIAVSITSLDIPEQGAQVTFSKTFKVPQIELMNQ